MNLSGANTATVTETIPSLAAGDSAALVLDAPATNAGTSNHYWLLLPNDNNNANNTASRMQMLDCGSLQYASDENGCDSTGLPGFGGIMAVKFPVPEIAIKVDAVTFRVSRDPNMNGESVSAVILDDYGNIVASSDPFVLADAMMGTDQTIQLSAPAYFLPGENFYAGILQNSGSIYPLGTARRKGAPSGINYVFDASGGIGTEDIVNG